MSDKTSMGDRLKAYEAAAETTLMRRTPKIIRLDGKAFHTVLSKCKRPFDPRVRDAMNKGAQVVLDVIGGTARFAYTQSDECTIALNDAQTYESQPWFGNRVQKVCSVAAAAMTHGFGIAARDSGLWEDIRSHGLPIFDCRFYQVPDLPELLNVFLWRQRDAAKNSISMYAQEHFSERQLHGKNSSDKQEMLFQHHGFNWNDAPTWTKRGSVSHRENYEPQPSVIRSRFTTDLEPPLFDDPAYLFNLWNSV